MRFVALFIALTMTAQAASIWPNGSRLQTFQNGFLFGNNQTLDAATDQFNFSGGARFEGPLALEDDTEPAPPTSGFNKFYFESNVPKAIDENGNVRPMVSPNIYGENVTEEVVSDQITLPNEQATKTGDNSTLIETGNLNILRNPDFEHETTETGWTCTGGTRSGNLSNSITGIKTLRVINSSDTFRCEQKTSGKALRFANTQGLASARVKTTNPAVQVCAIVNDLDTNCINVNNNDAWQLYEIPFVMGGTNNGIVIKGATGTGTSFLDDTYVGIIKPGMITETGAVGPWIDYTPTFQGLGTVTVIDARYRVVGSSIELNVAFTSGTTTATELRVGLPSGFSTDTGSTTNVVVGNFIKGIGTLGAIKRDVVIAPDAVNYVLFASGEYAIAANPSIGLNGNAILGLGDRASFFATVPIAGLNSRVSLYSQQCRRPSDCENVLSAKVSSTGVVSDENLDWVNGDCVFSSGSYVCTFNSGIFSVTPNCSITSGSGGSATYGRLNSTATSSSQVGFILTTGVPTNEQNPAVIACTKAAPDHKERNMITGTFRDVVTSPGAGSPALCSAKISSTGVISDQIGGCFVSCTNATTPVCTFTSNYWVSGSVPNCKVQPVAAASAGPITTTTTTVAGQILNASNAAISGARQLECHGIRQ